MRTLALGTLVLALFVPSAALAEDPPAAPGAPASAQVVEELKSSLAANDEEGAVEALRATKGLTGKDLVREVKRAAQRKEHAVRAAAIFALGQIPDPDALDVLHDLIKSDRALKDDDDLFALALRETGRHGNERSLKLLLDDPFKWLTVASGTARLMALAQIRRPATVEGLIAMGKKVGSGGGRMGTQNEIVAQLRPAYRVAMVVLTGHDEGPGAGLRWATWWDDQGKKAGIAPARPPVPREVRAFWEAFWREPYGVEDPKAEGATARTMEIVTSPSGDQVKEAVAALEAAFDAKDDERIAEALQRYGGVHDKAVLHELARGLTSSSARVRWVTVDTLGWSRYPAALKQLHRMVARERNLAKDDEALFAHLLKSIGRHGDRSSIEVLTNDPLKNLTYASGRARILGLARTRSKEAIDELLKAMKLAGDRPRRRGGDAVVPRFLQDFRLALMVLTGEDLGLSKEAWIDWWRKNDRSFKISPVPPTLPPAAKATWEEYWDEPYANLAR
jgi:HEAT repeat protein